MLRIFKKTAVAIKMHVFIFIMGTIWVDKKYNANYTERY